MRFAVRAHRQDVRLEGRAIKYAVQARQVEGAFVFGLERGRQGAAGFIEGAICGSQIASREFWAETLIRVLRSPRVTSIEKWIVYAFISMAFAGFTSVIAKLGLSGISGDLGLAVRTCFVFAFVLLFAVTV